MSVLVSKFCFFHHNPTLCEDVKGGEVISWVVESQSTVKSRDLLELLFLKVEVGDVQILLESGLGVGLWNDGNIALGDPSEDDLSWGLVVLLGNAGDNLVLEERWGIGGLLPAELEEGGWAEGGVGGDGNFLLLGQADEGWLDEVWVVLDLKGSWADLGDTEEVEDQRSLEVGDSNGTDEFLLNERLHGGPGLLDAGVGELDGLSVGTVPSWWVAFGWVDVLQGDWEVDDEEVEVLKTPVGQLLEGNWLDVLLLVEGVPQLGDDEELLALDQALIDGAGDTLTSLLLVAVVAGTIEETVTGLDGVVDSIGTGVVVDLPETEANLWHLIAGAELDGWDVDHICGFGYV